MGFKWVYINILILTTKTINNEKIFDFIGRDITQIQMTSNNKVRVWFGLRSQEMTLTEFNYLMIKKKQREEKRNQLRELTELVFRRFCNRSNDLWNHEINRAL